jgi:hypothetical protein
MMSRAWVHELPEECVFLGGRPAERPTYRIVLGVPAGTLLHGPGPVGSASRQALSREVAEIVLEVEGTPYSDVEAARIYCIVDEITDGHWGGLGTIFRIEDIVAFGNPEAPQTAAAEAGRKALAEWREQGALTEQLG